METLWVQVKIEKESGKVVLYDSSIPNEFIKSSQYEEFYNICMDFGKKLKELKDK